MLAKPIVDDRFWILEDPNLGRVGTMQTVAQGVQVNLQGSVTVYENFQQAAAALSLQAVNNAQSAPATMTWYSNGYPTNVQPYNEMYNAQLGLPIYTKTERSKSFHAAGYYIIRFDFAWAQAYCPKVVTLKNNPYAGPYRTRLEMQEQLRKHNADLKNSSYC